MNALDEMSRRYRHGDDEIDPITAKAEDPDVTPEELSGMVNKIFSVGFERRKELDALCKAVRREVQPLRHLSDGTYSINYAHVGQYADFSDRANHDFLKEKYKWLHNVGDGLGFDEDKGAESHHTFEDFLASIPHEDWTDFLSDMDDLSQDGVLDEQGAQDLEMKEQDRWMKEDGAPDLVKAMMNSVGDAYEAYLLQKVTPDMVWEWCRDTDHYPESQGEGSVWMDMDRLGKERETQEWFLEQLEDDLAGWEQAKKAQFDDLAGDLLDRPSTASVNNTLTLAVTSAGGRCTGSSALPARPRRWFTVNRLRTGWLSFTPRRAKTTPATVCTLSMFRSPSRWASWRPSSTRTSATGLKRTGRTPPRRHTAGSTRTSLT